MSREVCSAGLVTRSQMLVQVGGSQAHNHPCGSCWWPFLAEPRRASPALSWHGPVARKLQGLGWRRESGLWHGGEGRQESTPLHCSARAGAGLSNDFLTIPETFSGGPLITTQKEIEGHCPKNHCQNEVKAFPPNATVQQNIWSIGIEIKRRAVVTSSDCHGKFSSVWPQTFPGFLKPFSAIWIDSVIHIL